MKCPNCNADCSDQATECDFCGHSLAVRSEHAKPPTSPLAPPASPPSPPPSPAPDKPYADDSRGSPPAENVPNHLTFAIVATIVSTLVSFSFCCCFPIGLPPGIAAIVYALKVNKMLAADNLGGALEASKTAKIWCWVTAGLAIFFGVLLVVSIAMHGMDFMDAGYFDNFRKPLLPGR